MAKWIRPNSNIVGNLTAPRPKPDAPQKSKTNVPTTTSIRLDPIPTAGGIVHAQKRLLLL
ncbi:hypothetical protein VKT23_009343 [Stygiomarasmius scandens]|uniref:Uncharacterized protein n=1 Tax=Marasmiellus scandens TaxID=2682957 RepID=A0ABR1JHS0_9AGAR